MGINLQILDTSTGRIIAERNLSEKNYNPRADAGAVLINNTLKKLSSQVVSVCLKSLYPVKIIDKQGKTVILNYGEKGEFEKDEMLEVFAVKQVEDPDTGEMLGVEFNVGQIRVVNVSEQTTTASIVEDFGVTKGAVVKKIVNETQKPEKKINKKAIMKSDDW